MLNNKSRYFCVAIAVFAALGTSSTAGASTMAKKKIKTNDYKVKEIKKLLSFGNDKSITSYKTLYGTSTALVPKALVRGQEQTSNETTILNQVPGVSATSTNVIGTKPHISIRGFGQTQIGFTYDNIPISDALFGGLTGGSSNYADLYNLVPVSLGETDGVQVYYGTPPPFVNAVGALAGSINYLPRMPTNKAKGNVNVGYGSFGTISYGATLNTGLTKYGKLLVRFRSRQTKNYYDGTPDADYNYYASYVLPSSTPLSRWSAIFVLNKSHGYVPTTMPVSILNKYGNSYQWPHSFTYNTSKSESLIGILQNKSLITNHLSLSTKLFYGLSSYQQVTYANPYTPIIYHYQNANGGIVPAETVCQANGDMSSACLAQEKFGTYYHHYVDDVNSYGATSDFHYVSRKLTARVGGTVLVSSMEPNYTTVGDTPNNLSLIQGYNDTYNQTATRVNSRLFAQASYRFYKYLKLTGGLSYNNMSTTQTDSPGYFFKVGGTTSKTYDNISPYVSITVYPSKHSNFYIDYGSSYKDPNFSTFFFPVGNATATTPPTPILAKAEKVSTIQLGYNYSKRNLSAMMSIYRSNFSNTFTSIRNSLGQTYEYNLGTSSYTGLDVALAYQPINSIKLYANYSLQKASYTQTINNSTYGVQVFNGEPRPNTPTYLANIGADFNFYHTNLNAYYHFVGPEYIEASSGAPTSLDLPSFSQLNLSVSHKFKFKTNLIRSVTANLSVINLLNSHALVLAKEWPYLNGSGQYLEGEPMQPLSLFGSLTISF